MTSRLARIACGLAVVGLTGCEAAKSSNPTAPTVAGPIPGVNISAPVLLEPAQGFKFKENEQPIRLVVQNATTNGARPLTYNFEVAADSSFDSKVFSRSGVAPGEGNKTSVQIDRLEIGRAYYWRAWAVDGANTGVQASAGFEIYPKPAVTAPTAVSPVNNEAVPSTTPTLKVHNASFVGPVGGLTYEFQIATDQAFTKLAHAGFASEGSGDTTFNSVALSAATNHFWRARASDGENTSAWSGTQSFRTPNAPTPSPPSPPPTGGGGGGSCISTSGPEIIKCISNKYPDKIAPVGSLGQRQDNMKFLRDRIIEAGRCAGNNYSWNLKRGGPDLSIDVIAWKRADGNMGVDIGFDYDNISVPLKLVWSEVDLFASWTPYTNSYSCSGV